MRRPPSSCRGTGSARCWRRSRRRPSAAVAWHGRGRTVALAVLGDAAIRRHRIVRARRWVLNATGDPALDCVHFEHNGFHWPLRTSGWDGLLDAFAASTGIDEIGLPGVATPPPVALVEQRGLLREETSERSFAVELGALSERSGDVAAILSRNSRSQLRRALHKLDPVRLGAAASEAEALDYFRTLRRSTFLGGNAGPAARVRPRILPTLPRTPHRPRVRRGAIQLLRLRSGDRTLGILYNFRRGNRCTPTRVASSSRRSTNGPASSPMPWPSKRAWQGGRRDLRLHGRRESAEAQQGTAPRRCPGPWFRSRSCLRAERLALGGVRRTVPPPQVVPGTGRPRAAVVTE